MLQIIIKVLRIRTTSQILSLLKCLFLTGHNGPWTMNIHTVSTKTQLALLFGKGITELLKCALVLGNGVNYIMVAIT